jgi:DNA-binding LacI/PurR family transcriptional regulator
MNNRRTSPTIADVASLAGVSISTVSRVLNGTAVVVDETFERVQKAIDELQYVPQAAARMLASKRTNTLGLMLPEISGAFFAPMIRGIETGVRQAGYDMLIYSTHNPQASEGHPHHRLRRPLGEHNTDGLLVFTNSLEQNELERLYTLGFPVVLLYLSPPAGIDFPVVTIENQKAAQALVSHLIEEHGRRRIVFLRGPEGHEDSELREAGYRRALEVHGLAFDPNLVARGEFIENGAYLAMQQLIKDGVAFDAVFSGDDDSASGVLRALREAGIRVPEAVSLAGFDDLPYAQHIAPPLTTVHSPIEQVGLEAVRVLIRLICGESVEPRLVLPTQLVIRQSCGCT